MVSSMDEVLAVDADFRVVAESPDWIVVDKAAPLVVHPTGKKDEPTLLGGLEALLAYELANGVRLSIINRLDRETSGLVVVAKNAQAAGWFGKRMQSRELRKGYLALVHGWPQQDEWEVDAPMLRAADVGESPIFVRQIVHPAGRACVTRFRVVRRFVRRGARFSEVACEPLTGRMHQIRVHLAESGHPIVGDKIYQGEGEAYLEFIETGWTEALAARLLLARHALHSCRIEFESPEGELVRWECGLPRDLQEFGNCGEME